jgi:hypothetical protein
LPCSATIRRRVNLAEHAVLHAPSDHVLKRVEDLVPGSAKRLGRFLPGQPARPTGQKQHVGFGQLTLTVSPANFLDDDGAATSAIYASHCIQKEDKESPQGDELEATLAEFVVAGCRLMTTRADRR